jgi:hypothetical protein
MTVLQYIFYRYVVLFIYSFNVVLDKYKLIENAVKVTLTECYFLNFCYGIGMQTRKLGNIG